MTDKEMLAALKPGDKIQVGDSRDLLLVRHLKIICGERYAETINGGYLVTDIMAVHVANYAPPYKLGEPESVTREQAKNMIGPNWYVRLYRDAVRRLIVLSPDRMTLDLDGKDFAVSIARVQDICSPGGNFYRVEG